MVATAITEKQPWYRTCGFRSMTVLPRNPKPVGHARHFHNEASRREYRAIELPDRDWETR